MDSDTIYEFLSKVSFFVEFTNEEKQAISKLSNTILGFQGGEVIIRQKDVGASIYILLKGSASVMKNDQSDSSLGVAVGVLKPGSVFGEMSLLGKRPRSTTIIAEEDVVVLKLLTENLEKMPPAIASKFKDQFIKVLIRRLDDMNKTMARLSRYDD